MDTTLPMSPPTTGTDTEAGPGPVRRFLGLSGRALLEPARFFRDDLPALRLSDALALGITNAWLASVIAFFFETLNTFVLTQLLERWMQRLLAAEEGFGFFGLSGSGFLYNAGLLLLGPFLFLARALFASVGLFLAARLLIEDDAAAPEPVTYAGVMRIEGAALTSQWFGVVPIFGGLLAFVVSLVLTVTGVRERFGVSNRRALAVVLAPYVLLLFAALLVGLLLLVALFQFPMQELLEGLDANALQEGADSLARVWPGRG